MAHPTLVPYLDSNLTKILEFPPAPNYGKMNYSDNKLKEMVSFFISKEPRLPYTLTGSVLLIK